VQGAQVVRNLLDFARKEDFHLGLTDVNETVEPRPGIDSTRNYVSQHLD
jgi:hypothetical protein